MNTNATEGTHRPGLVKVVGSRGPIEVWREPDVARYGADMWRVQPEEGRVAELVTTFLLEQMSIEMGGVHYLIHPHGLGTWCQSVEDAIAVAGVIDPGRTYAAGTEDHKKWFDLWRGAAELGKKREALAALEGRPTTASNVRLRARAQRQLEAAIDRIHNQVQMSETEIELAVALRSKVETPAQLAEALKAVAGIL